MKTYPKPKLSKRFTLSRLPDRWRETIFSSLHSERLKLAVAVIASTGCRPSELEMGVLVNCDGEQLRFGIRGTKVDEDTCRGQPLRLITVESGSPWAQFLLSKVKEEESGILFVKYDAEGVSQRLREKSRELWPRRSTLISAYTFRHFLGKSMKESRLAPIQIASVLGHASDYTQTVYGRAGGNKKSAGQHGIVSSLTKNPIRHSPRTDRLNRFVVNPKIHEGDMS